MKFSEQRASEVAAYFLHRAAGSLPILKLMKLMYLAERESYRRFGEPLTGDTLCSMDHGPILSTTLNHVNGLIDSQPNGWDSWIKDHENRMVSLQDQRDGSDENLLHLSDADIDVLRSVWSDFGHMTGSQLRNYTHRECGEWEDPNGSSTMIPPARLLRCVGYSQAVAQELVERLTVHQQIETSLDRISS
jgi:uncharacterized phage-associated protein